MSVNNTDQETKTATITINLTNPLYCRPVTFHNKAFDFMRPEPEIGRWERKLSPSVGFMRAIPV
ncbi:MAG: hypothetical protein V3U75_05095 [Methylococcaceae bacterium]